MANGVALAHKFSNKSDKIWSVIGDGELNEGAVNEAMPILQQIILNM